MVQLSKQLAGKIRSEVRGLYQHPNGTLLGVFVRSLDVDAERAAVETLDRAHAKSVPFGRILLDESEIKTEKQRAAEFIAQVRARRSA